MTKEYTRVHTVRLKNGLAQPEEEKAQARAKEEPLKPTQKQAAPLTSSAVLTTCPKAGGRESRMRTLDNLLRNVAVVGAALMVLVALRGAGNPQAQSVFSALQTGTNMEWDESLGKLSFVSNLLPESVQAVWSNQEAITVMAPIRGDVVHAWSQAEPYVEFESVVSDVRAVASGEIMSVVHGLDEELIIRLRHEDQTESIYGNLAECHMDVGDYVFQGDIIATVLQGKPLAFELRKDGRSIDPSGKLQSWTD